MKEAVIIGGTKGIGLGIAHNLTQYDKIHLLARSVPEYQLPSGMEFHQFDISSNDYSLIDSFVNNENVEMLVISSGFGDLKLFDQIADDDIDRYFNVNTIGVLKVLRHFYSRITSPTNNFYTVVLSSICGIISSPFFSIYASTKAALHRFIETVNVELEKSGSINRILEVSPGQIKGTSFTGGATEIELLKELSAEIIKRAISKELLFIPNYESTFKGVINRYQDNPHQFGLESYDYKLNSGRVNNICSDNK